MCTGKGVIWAELVAIYSKVFVSSLPFPNHLYSRFVGPKCCGIYMYMLCVCWGVYYILCIWYFLDKDNKTRHNRRGGGNRVCLILMPIPGISILHTRIMPGNGPGDAGAIIIG